MMSFFIFHRAGRRALTLVTIFLAGCTSPESRRSQVSDQLLERTGHSLAAQAEPGTPSLPPGVSLDRPLTEDEAVAVALWNNAAFQQLLSELGLARADIVMAGQIANPTFMTLFPLGPKQLEYLAKVPVDAIWQRKRRVEAAETRSSEVAERMVQGGLDLIRDVRLACADLRLADGNVALMQESAALLKRIAGLAQSRFQAGDIGELETTAAQVAALNAEQAWSRAKADASVARIQLRTLLGLGQNRTDLTLAESSVPSRPSRHEVRDLVATALANRPDLRAAELALEAAGARAKISRREIYTLTVLLDGNGTGSDANFGPGVEFPIPVFNQNQGGIAVADAQLEQAARRYVAVRDQIDAEVHLAHVRWEDSLASMRVWRDELHPALESSVCAAKTGAASGDLAPLQALEAERTLNTALLNQQRAFADWHRATAELERAIGRRLDSALASTTTSSPVAP